MNEMILQPPDTCVQYGQGCRTDHSTESSYESPPATTYATSECVTG